MMGSGYRLTGSHVRIIVGGFFLTIFAANAIFISLAVKSFPGEQEKKSYLQGLAYNDHLRKLEAQEALEWSIEIESYRISDGRVIFKLGFTTSDGRPISDMEVSASLGRTVDDDADHWFKLAEDIPGQYSAEVAGVAAGAWRFSAIAKKEGVEPFALEKRLLLK